MEVLSSRRFVRLRHAIIATSMHVFPGERSLIVSLPLSKFSEQIRKLAHSSSVAQSYFNESINQNFL